MMHVICWLNALKEAALSSPDFAAVKQIALTAIGGACLLLVGWVSGIPSQMKALEDFKVSVVARVEVLEKRQQDYLDSQNILRVELARLSTTLVRVESDIGDIKRDMKALTYKPSLMRSSEDKQ